MVFSQLEAEFSREETMRTMTNKDVGLSKDIPRISVEDLTQTAEKQS